MNIDLDTEMYFEDLNKKSDTDILILLNESVDEYESQVQANWHLEAPYTDDAMYVALKREDIQDLINICDKRKIEAPLARIKKIDETWRAWILKCISEGEVDEPFYDKKEEPLEKWWLHFQSLDKLV